MAELWSLRITVKGATKTFGNVDPSDTVATLADRAAQDFRCKGGLDLAGGFPPKALDAASKLSDVTTNNAALRGIEKKRAAPARKPAQRKKAKGPPVDDRRAAALRAAEARAAGIEPVASEINPAPAPSRPQPLATAPKAPRRRRLNMASSEGGVGIDLASAAAGESGTRGKFFRKALKGAVEGRYEDTKAEDRVSACQSGKFEIAVSETTLSGNASKLKVTFAKGHGSRGNHEDVVDALTREETVAAVRQAVSDGDADMLRPENCARASQRVFWSLVRHSNGKFIPEALEELVPEVGWAALFAQRRRRGCTRAPPPVQAPVQAPVPPPPPSQNDRRRAALAAAEARAAEEDSSDDDDDDPIVRKLVEICGVNGYNALKRGNVQTPRDLAAWRGAGDVLRDMLIEEGVAADACPGAAALGAWADAASKALTEDPSLGAHVSGFRGGA
jgi:hypothetical protein